MPQDQLPEEIELYRDRSQRREPELQIGEVLAAERLIDRVGFCAALTDARRPAFLYTSPFVGDGTLTCLAIVQKDPESSPAWTIKDEAIRRGRVYYGKLRGNRSVFIARRLIPYFNAVCGVSREQESVSLSQPAQDILKVLRKEWEIATRDLRRASGVIDRTAFNKAIDELQKVLKVIPSEVVYQANFYLCLVPGQRQISGGVGYDCEQGRSVEGDRSHLPQWGGDESAGRTCARYGIIQPGGEHRQLGACR